MLPLITITGQQQSEKAGVCLLCSTMSSGVSRNHPRFGKCAFLVPPKTIPAKDATRVYVNESALPEKRDLVAIRQAGFTPCHRD